MALDYTRKTSRRRISLMDVLHTILGGGAVVLFIFMLTDFDANRKLIPFIIFIASVMNGAEAIYKIQHLPHGKKNLGGIFMNFGLAVLLFFIAAFTWIVFYW